MSNEDGRDRDPGDAVPPGVAVRHPTPLTEHDREVKRKLEHLGPQPGASGKETGGPGTGGGETGNRDE